MNHFERQTLTIEEAARLLGISRSLAYETARSGTLGGVRVIRIGRRLLVPRDSINRLLTDESDPDVEHDKPWEGESQAR